MNAGKETKDLKPNEIRYIENDRNVAKYKHTVNDSELLRIMEAVDPSNVNDIRYGHKTVAYIDGLISVNVRYNTRQYNEVKDANGILAPKHWKWINENEGKMDEKEKPLESSSKQVKVLDENGSQVKERFKRLIVASGHNRGKKALFVREDLFDKVNKILLGGIDEYSETNGYPKFKKGYAKWSSYYGLASTDSKVVSTPKIIVIKDFTRTVNDTFDIVRQTKTLNKNWKDGNDLKDKYLKKYDVKNKTKKTCSILPFDGAGLVSVDCAKKWADELDIRNGRGKRYIPAAYQFRAIPGMKGNLYTFDIMGFAKDNGWIITDNKGRKHDLREEQVDVILTESQTKFISLFDDDINLWYKVFDEPVKFEDGTEYKRTFNISEYSEDVCDVKHRMLSAYQHLQTIENTEEEKHSMIKDTIDMLEKISTDVNEFLKYRSCTDDKENSCKKEWERIPPYYRAAYYASDENKTVIFSDSYFKRKVAEDIKGAINRALSGKLYFTGNYQVLTPDIYALAEYAFGKRGDEVKGLLQAKEIYANWWLVQSKKDKEKYSCDELALIRNPHIYMEARVAKMVTPEDDEERYEKIKEWYKYQRTGIVTDSYSTIPLALGTADFDGDHIASTNCSEYIAAVKRAIEKGLGNTIDWECAGETGEEKIKESADVSDIKKLMEFDILAYGNDIGTVIDKVTALWGIKKDSIDSGEIRDYIKIMDIIGQLTIDAAKTGEFEKIPEDIKLFLENKQWVKNSKGQKVLKNIKAGKKILKPYFMKYLQKNENKRKTEADAKEGAEFFFDSNKDIVDKQLKFSDDNTNMNSICHIMEQEIASINKKVDSIEFSTEAFLNIFCSEKPNVTSGLYINIKNKLQELKKQHNRLYACFAESFSDEDKDDKVNHYRYFYMYAREELLSICKLSEEKSLNKVLNCIIYAAYADRDFVDDDGIKNILWNCFDAEMIRRAKGDKIDTEIDWKDIDKKAAKLRKLKQKKLSKYLEEKELCIKELENNKKQYSPIIIRESDIKMIQTVISEQKMKEKDIAVKHREQLLKLYAVLIILSKCMECDRIVGKNKIRKRCIMPLTIRRNSNNCLNYSNLAKLCGFNDYQRKQIKVMLRQLKDLEAVTVYPNNLKDITIHVNYEKIENGGNEASLVPEYDYKSACTKLLELIETA